jgi:catechol 2,3-dioxygenase-like lactoylglutathione lyase family enzyme
MTYNLRPDHFTILTDDLSATESFYTDLLGFTPGPRPTMSRPGIWLYSGGKAILHVMHVDTLPDPRRGVLDHMAFRSDGRGDGMEDLIAALKARDLDYRLIKTPDPWQQWQLFFEGPSGEMVEVDFDGA